MRPWLLLPLAIACTGKTDDPNHPQRQAHDDTAADTADDSGGGGDSGTADDSGGGDDTAGGDDTSDPVVSGPGEFDLEMTVDGIHRTYTLYVPDSAVAAMDDGPVPLLMALHGAGDEGANFIHATQLTNLADSNAFVLLGPDGWGNAWFVSDSEGWPGADGSTNSYPNDLLFMERLIDSVSSSYRIDDDHLFATGHSRGAGFTTLLAAGSGQLSTSQGGWTSPFDGYVVNAGYDPFGGSLDLSASQPKAPVWVIHGTSDTTVPYSYGEDLADSLQAAGWDVKFTAVSGAGHSWLFRSSNGQTDQDLWDWCMAAGG